MDSKLVNNPSENGNTILNSSETMNNDEDVHNISIPSKTRSAICSIL